MHFERFRDKNQQWRLRLKGENGEVILSGEAYESERNLDETLESIAKALGDEGAGRLAVVTEGGVKIESLADWSPTTRGE